MSWSADDSDDRVVAVRAQSKAARGQQTTWPFATLIVFWLNALQEVQSEMYHSADDVDDWATEGTCPASVERLVNEGGALLVDLDAANGGEFEEKTEKQLEQWRAKIREYSNGDKVLLDDSGDPLNEVARGHQVTDTERDEMEDDGYIVRTTEGYQPEY